jgi:sarcosine oxidase, subunit beta
MTPDRHAIVGAAEECPSLYLVNGSSGHGVMHAPALGQVLAEWIAGERTAVDVSALRPSRFREGAAIEAPELL